MKNMLCRLVAAVAAVQWCVPTWAEEAYDFRKRLEIVHQADRRDPAAKCAADEYEVRDGFRIGIAADAGDFVYRAARDFEDYLAVSMKVNASLVRGAGDLTLALGGTDGYSVEVDGMGVKVTAADVRLLAQALYHLEDLMNLREGPFLKKGVERRRPYFDVRMTHSGYGNDIFPDEHLAQMAHYGMTAILVFLDDIDKTKAQEYQDLKALIRRAAKYGLDTYLYSYIKAFAHPRDEGGKEVFEQTYGRIAGYYPEAKGIILVGESCQFPSKDPRVQPRTWKTRDPNDKRPLAGWFPCADYPEWLKSVKDAIRAKAPRQELVFWTYNWGWAPKADRLKLIDALPVDVTLMATFEMFERRTLRNGLDTPSADYTISFPGPGKYFTSEAERAAKNGLRLYSQANCGGLTWDFGDIPYQPVPQQWNRRWSALVAAHGTWGLSGVMENHHYGWWPSFVSELEKEAFTEGGMPFDEHLRKIAARDYGAGNAETVVTLWDAWSRNANDFAPTDCNQYGTFRIGSAYPFAFGDDVPKREDFPGKKYASNWPAGITRLDYLKEGYVAQLTPERMDDGYFRKEIELFEPMVEAYAGGARQFAAMADALSGRRRENARRMANFAKYLACSVRTAVNMKRGAIAFRAGDTSKLREIARLEYENAREALVCVEADSRLGWEPSMEYCGGPEQIRWKLKMMEDLYGFTSARR